MHTTVWNKNIQAFADVSDAAASDSNQFEKDAEKTSVVTLVSCNFYLSG